MLQRTSFLRVILAPLIFLLGCGTNPVTGKSELQLISESEEIAIGEQYYDFLKQIEGGDYTADRSITTYIQNVGRKLAEVSDRPHLPYVFSVLDNTIPNAWALPGGKIAINIGLLVRLENEAELAAVLSHEIVHSAARHGAQAMQRDAIMQSGLGGLSQAVGGSSYEMIVMQGAQIGMGLISTKYSRSAELEADKYGINYMYRAGYDPEAAIDLQKMFVRLDSERDKDFLDGLFATHPPSEERVIANQQTAAQFPPGGYDGGFIYRTRIHQLKDSWQGYEFMEKGYQYLRQGKAEKALELAEKAIDIDSYEGHFYNLQGKAQILLKRYEKALSSFSTAIEKNDNYFEYYLQRGLLKQRMGLNGREDLKRSFKLLPTEEAYRALGGAPLKIQ
jgi:tetratricopeptide (TPR) repeat protein